MRLEIKVKLCIEKFHFGAHWKVSKAFPEADATCLKEALTSSAGVAIGCF
jgi:hypothetical protein